MNTPDSYRRLHGTSLVPARSPATWRRAARTPGLSRSCAVLAALLSVSTAAQAQHEAHEPAQVSIASQLAEMGLTPSLVFANLTTYNASVGSRKRKWGNSGNIFVGLDADLGQSLGWQGTELHFLHTFFPFLHGTGQPASEKWPGSAGAYHAGAMLHNDLASGYLSRFSLSQKALDDRLYLEAGRLNARQIFLVANCESMISCTDPLLDTATGTLPYPYGSWGAYGRYHWEAAPSSYMHAGVFESNVQVVLDKKTGYDWRTKDASGLSLFAGVGRRTDYGEIRYPGSYELNVFHNTALQTDPLTNETRRGNTGFLLRARQAVWRADGGASVSDKPEAVEVFSAFSYSAYAAAPFRFNAELGLTWRGWLQRPDDLLNVKFGWQRMSSNQQTYQRLQRVDAGGANIASHANTFRLEANTHIAATRNAFVEFSVQYLFQPDSFYRPAIPERTPAGFVFGLQYVWNFGKTLGL